MDSYHLHLQLSVVSVYGFLPLTSTAISMVSVYGFLPLTSTAISVVSVYGFLPLTSTAKCGQFIECNDKMTVCAVQA